MSNPFKSQSLWINTLKICIPSMQTTFWSSPAIICSCKWPWRLSAAFPTNSDASRHPKAKLTSGGYGQSSKNTSLLHRNTFNLLEEQLFNCQNFQTAPNWPTLHAKGRQGAAELVGCPAGIRIEASSFAAAHPMP